MQTHGGTAAEAAITSAERVFRASIRVDWNNNGLYDHPMSRLDKYIIDIGTDRSLSGSAPEELLLIEGSSSCELTLNIHGDYDNLSLISVFSPFNTLSPFYGKRTMDIEIQYSILVDTLFGTFEYPQFIGNIRTITPNRSDNKVEITALDRAEKMRRPIQLPPFAISDEHVSYGEIDTQLIRSEWVIDHALRLCNSGVTPKRPVTRQELMLGPAALDGVQLWVTGNGSYLPSIGYLDNLNASSFPNPPKEMYGANGPLHPSAPVGTNPPLALKGVGSPIEHNYYRASDEGVIRYWVADQDALNAAAVHFFGCTLYIPGSNIASIGQYQLAEIILGNTEYLQVWVQTGRVWVERYRTYGSINPIAETTPVTIPTTGTHVDIFVQVDLRSSQTPRAYVRAGTNTNGATGQTIGSAVSTNTDQNTDQIKGRVTLGQAVTLSDFFYATSNQSDVPPFATDRVYRTPEYPAVLDMGLNRFSFIPTAKRQEAWTLVADVAAAEFGSVYWDENGTFRFLNWESMLAKRNDIARTFSLDDVENLSFANNTDSIRNAYTVTTTKKRSAGIMNLYESQDQNEFYTPARTESRFRIWLDDVLSPLTYYMERFDGVKREGTDTPAEWKEEYNEVASKLNWDKQGFVVQFFDGGTWKEVPGRGSLTDIRVTAYFTSDGYLTVRVRNRTSYDIRLAKDRMGDVNGSVGQIDSQAAFRIAGTKILEGTTLPLVYENDTSIGKYGVRTLDLSGDWYQDALWTTDLLDVITPRSAEPVPTTDAITVAGDPRLQLGDVIKVTDPKGFGSNIQLQVYGINRTYSLDEGLTDTLTVEVVPPPPPPPDPDDPDPPQPFVPRFNLCPNPACARDDDGWWGDTGQGRVSVTGMSRSTGFSAGSGDSVVTPQAAVMKGKTYRFSADIKGNGASSNVAVNIDWYSNGGYMSSSPSQSWSVTNGGVTRAYTPAAVAPLGATKALLVVNGFDGNAVVSAVMYEQTDQTLPYFDGDSPGARWDGAAGSSSSRLVEPA